MAHHGKFKFIADDKDRAWMKDLPRVKKVIHGQEVWVTICPGPNEFPEQVEAAPAMHIDHQRVSALTSPMAPGCYRKPPLRSDP